MELLEAFFKKEYSGLVKKINFRVRHMEDSEDIVMEAFGRAAKHFKGFNPEYKEFGAWFNTILKNCLKDYQREKFVNCIETVVDEEIPVDDKLPVKFLKEQVKRDIDALVPEARRDSCYLFFIVGFSYQEIEEATGISVRNARFYTDEFKKLVRDKYG